MKELMECHEGGRMVVKRATGPRARDLVAVIARQETMECQSGFDRTIEAPVAGPEMSEPDCTTTPGPKTGGGANRDARYVLVSHGIGKSNSSASAIGGGCVGVARMIAVPSSWPRSGPARATPLSTASAAPRERSEPTGPSTATPHVPFPASLG